MLKKGSLFLYALVCAGIVLYLASLASPSRSEGKKVTLKLSRGDFSFLSFPGKGHDAPAILVFASGDGGWGPLEEQIARAFQSHGYDVIGVDSVTYAESDYDLPMLQADFTRIAQAAEKSYGSHRPPLVMGGYSMGAAQAIAIAGGPHPPPGLVGLFLVDPCSRGRYGLRTSDQLNVLPTGPGTFSMDDFGPAMKNLRVVQWHAENDSIDSRQWRKSLAAPHREYDFPGAGHDYRVNRDVFIHELVESMGWILKPGASASMADEP
jgi:phosphatidylglycerol lysyltransferase